MSETAKEQPKQPKTLPEASVEAQTARAVEELEQVLRRRKVQRWTRTLYVAGAIGLSAAGYHYFGKGDEGPTEPRFVTAAVETRDVVETVESSGKLRPVTEVQVGTQVSGRVVKVHVDFNSRVEQGQLLAEVDPSLFGAQVQQVAGQLQVAKAQAERARAARRSAKIRLDRVQRLAAESIASGAELDDAENAMRLAEADVVAADAQITGLTAQLKSANTTLGYTRIYSPIDGVVVTRAVDPGQTVAASFSAPVLFVIAQNLADMQVLADIDEADVGKVRENMKAKVSVDAFPGQSFAGTVTQIRYSPTEVQGVVTYAAVIDVKNDELKLRPGMTATVSVTTNEVEGRPAVRNAALRFKPRDPESAGSVGELEYSQRRVYVLASEAEPSAGQASAPAEVAPTPDPQIEPRVVGVGISDGVWTELTSGGLAVGDQVVIQERTPPKEERRKFLGLF